MSAIRAAHLALSVSVLLLAARAEPGLWAGFLGVLGVGSVFFGLWRGTA